MADEPKRSVFVKFWEHAVERTEAEIAELRAGGLLREDPGPAPAPAGSPPAAGTTTAPAGSPPPGGKPEIKE